MENQATETIRVRFAPSPTGELHIGGVRTALYNFLFARHMSGKFILRIEDTDRTRSAEGYTKHILEALQWLGIKWDEGPYFQTQRLDLYQKQAKRLLDQGKAYKRDDPGKGECIVFKLDQDYVEWDDLIHGRLGRDLLKEPHLVIIKSDGFPTYNFACVVDDIDLGITHVIRGDEHIANTPKQILLYRALSSDHPKFAHVPLILNPDGSKMSKDYKKKGLEDKEFYFPTSTLKYRELGYLPEGLVNFLALLGWSPGGDREIMSLDEMVELFTIERINHRPAQFNIEKLTWLNGYYIRGKSIDELLRLVLPFLGRSYDISKQPQDKLVELIKQQQQRMKMLSDIVELAGFFFDLKYDQKAVENILKKDRSKEILASVKDELARLEDFSKESINNTLKQISSRMGLSFKEVAQPLRVAITGSDISPPIDETVWILGKEEVAKRIAQTLEIL